MAKIIAVANQKGGVGKSTLSFHLAHAATAGNKRVLCLDLDSQGNLSQYLTGELDVIDDTEGGVGLLLEGKPFKPTPTTHPRIDLLHGHTRLDRYDNDSEVEERGYSGDMRNQLKNCEYDYVIIDTPPAVGFRHMAALVWADVVIIPMEPVMSSIVGFQNVISTLQEYVAPFNPNHKWFGVVNRANMRVKSHREKDEYVKSEYSRKILATLATRTAVSDAMEEVPAIPVWERKGVPGDLKSLWLNFCKRAISG